MEDSRRKRQSLVNSHRQSRWITSDLFMAFIVARRFVQTCRGYFFWNTAQSNPSQVDVKTNTPAGRLRLTGVSLCATGVTKQMPAIDTLVGTLQMIRSSF